MDRLQKARAKMLIKHPFFATLLMSTPMIVTRDVPTAGTDMAKLYINPDFIETLPNDEQVLTLFGHEVMHIALEHGLRLQGRNPMVWNWAADFAINLVLKEAGFEPIANWLCDDKYKDMSADQIYDLLQKECDKARKQGKGGKGQPGDGPPGAFGKDLMDPHGGGDPAAQAKLRRSVQQRVAQAANVARMAGKLSGSLERLVADILNPKVPWQEVLRDYMTRICTSEESWSKRNRRFRDVYLPARRSENRMGEIVMIGDTSGSIGNDELAKYMAEAGAIAEDVRPERIRIIWADTRVAGEQLFEEGEEIKAVPKGGGGTDMCVPLKHAEQYEPEVAILFTDGYTPWPSRPPEYPLIICCTTDVDVPPIGQVVRI